MKRVIANDRSLPRVTTGRGRGAHAAVAAVAMRRARSVVADHVPSRPHLSKDPSY
jgi:hypothetical protein